MVRRFLCLGTVLLLLLSVPACGGNNKKTPSTVKDPEGDFVPNAPGGGKGGSKAG
jgi:hypothetical protein